MAPTPMDTLTTTLRSSPLDLGGDVATQRGVFEELLAHVPVGDDVRVEERDLGGVPALRVVAGDGPTRGTVLGFHGGGYAIGSARTSVALMADVARRSGAEVLTVDYRLAPEHPYPAAVDDAVAALRALLHAGTDPGALVLLGESAGAGLALAALVAARDAGLPQPAAAVLLSPWVDLTLSGASVRTKAEVDPALTGEALRIRAAGYLAGADPRAALASPLFADLRGLAPLLVQVGGHEVLLDDALRLAAAAAAAGLDVGLDVVAGAPHVFQAFAAVLPEGAAALDRVGAFVREHVR